MIETFVRMLDTNTTLEYLKLYIEGDFYTRFARSFSAHDGEQLPPEELSSTRKLAFISIVHSGKSKRLENRLLNRGPRTRTKIMGKGSGGGSGSKGGGSSGRSGSKGGSSGSSKAAADNRSNQMNPNNSAYYSSRAHG
ncbi:hypothetical protein F444_05211 [Phytophthora nicotianae P1976]|nr:hypothetical protein F444_05211 [Phytophthora nicotianae P1976]